MTLKDVQKRVAFIEANRGDDEGAHFEQDELYRDVLRTIANGNLNGRALAREALKVDDIEFSRWYA